MVIASKGGFLAREHRRAFVNLALLRRLWNYVERHCIFIGEYASTRDRTNCPNIRRVEKVRGLEEVSVFTQARMTRIAYLYRQSLATC